jgi:hypothetical protein
MALSYRDFLDGLPAALAPQLPAALQRIKVNRPWRWLIQFHYGEPALHYEVSRPPYRVGLELGFHCEARDHDLNRFLLLGFRRNLFEIKDALGERIEAEMWDKGWTKIYEVLPDAPLTADYQVEVGARLAEIIVCLHPIFVALRNQVAQVYR